MAGLKYGKGGFKMDEKMADRFKKIYRERVLPKKSVTKGTPESCLKTLELYEELTPLRYQANQMGLSK